MKDATLKKIGGDAEVFIFRSHDGEDMEILSGLPKWDWESEYVFTTDGLEVLNEQRGMVWVANINGSDSLRVKMPYENFEGTRY